MKDPKLQSGRSKAADELSVALFELRDALVTLSLAMKDLQFETDREQRKVTGDATRQLLAQIASANGPGSA